MLATQDLRYLGGKPTDGHPGGIHDVPLLGDRRWFGYVSPIHRWFLFCLV
jgi:hypothetical protein